MAKTAAKIPTQKNLINIIKSEVETSNDIMKIIIESAKKCEKYEKISGELENYNKTIKFIFGENGLITSLNAINNINSKKIDKQIVESKTVVSNLCNLIIHISKEINRSNTLLNSIDITAFNNVYFNFISKLNDTFYLIKKFDFNLFLGIKLFFIRLQINTIKNFVEKVGENFKEISNNLTAIKSLLVGGTGIALIQVMLEKISEMFNVIYNFKFKFIKLFIKLKLVLLAIKMILNTIKKIGKYGNKIDYSNVVKSMVLMLYLVVILNALKNIFTTVNTIKIGIKFYIKLFFLRKALKRVFKLIETISEYNKLKIDSSVIKSFLFTLIILKITGWIFTQIKMIKTGFGPFSINKKIKKITKTFIALIELMTYINQAKVEKQSIKNIKLLFLITKKLTLIFKNLNKIKVKKKLVRRITLIELVLNKLVNLIEKISKLKVTKQIISKNGKLTILNKIVDKIKSIIFKVVLLSPLALIGIVAIIPISLFVITLSLLIWSLFLLFKLINTIIGSVRRGIRQIIYVFTSLILVGISMLLLAAAAPIILKAALAIIVLLGIILLTVGTIWLVMKLIEQITLKAAKKALTTSIYLIIIAGLFAIMSVSLLLVAYIGMILLPIIPYLLIPVAAVALFIYGVIALMKWLNKKHKTLISGVKYIAIIVTIAIQLLTLASIILGFGILGLILTPLLVSIIGAIAAVTAFMYGIVVLCKIISKFNKDIAKANIGLALVVTSALLLLGLAASLLILGKIGEQIKAGNTALNILIAVGCVTGFILAMVGLGFALTYGLAFLGMAIAGLATVLLAGLAVIGVGHILLKIGEIGNTMEDNNTANNVLKLLSAISKVGWRLAGLGAELVVIGASCLLVITFIGPLLRALTLVAAAGTQLIKLSEKEIDVEIVKKNINHIKTVWETYKKFANSFKIKDLLLLHTKTDRITSALTVSINTIYNIVNKLNSLTNINVDINNILTSVRSVLDFTKDLQQYINDILSDKEKSGFAFTRWIGRRQAKGKDKAAIKKFNRVEKIVFSIVNIADKLNEIKDISFDENIKKNITDSVTNIFNFVKDLENRINLLLVSDNTTPELLQVLSPSALEKGAKMDAARTEKLNSVDKVVSSLKNITDLLNSLQKITLNKGKIESNIDAIFKTVDDIALKIQQSIMGDKDSPIDKIFAPSTKWVYHEPEKWYQDGWWEAVPEENDTVKRLNNVDKIASIIGNVMKTIESLSKVNLNGAAKTNITNNIDNVFEFIDTIATKVHNFLTAQDTAAAELVQNENTAWIAAAKVKQSNFDENVERMAGTSDNISKVISTISNVMESVKKLKDFKLNQKDVDTINLNIETLFDTTGFIIRKVQQQLDENKVENPESITEKIEPILSGLERLNTGFESLGNVDTKNFKSNVNTFGTFVESINKVSVEKVEKTTKLFEKMSELTANMKGDFNKVAETLTEKLIPVLEDLKTIMVDVPEKLDKGFSNTSASIAAANQPPTTQGFMAQIKREEPNISEKEVERKAVERMNEKVQADSNGIAAKLDELIALFKGMGGDTAVVRTV